MADEDLSQDAKFNAGISIALDIFNTFRQGRYFASTGDYLNWHIYLEANERQMSPRFRVKEDANEELRKVHEKGMPFFKKYVKKMQHDKRVKQELYDNVKSYLIEYEECLIYWRDKFGYGMPLKEDMRKAAWR